MNENQNPGDSGSMYRYMAMNSAEVKAFVASDMSRMKDDIGDIYEKLNDLKDSVNDNHMAVISQITEEFRNIQNRFNDMSLGMQRIQMESEKSEFISESKLKEFETKLGSIAAQLDTISKTSHAGDDRKIQDLHRQIKDMKTQFDAALAAIKKSVDDLTKKEAKTSGKVAKMSWKLGLIIAAITWLASTFGKDALTSAFSSAVQSQLPAKSVSDTAKHVKSDTSKR